MKKLIFSFKENKPCLTEMTGNKLFNLRYFTGTLRLKVTVVSTIYGKHLKYEYDMIEERGILKMIMSSYYVVNLESVSIQKKHPYTLVLKGYIPTYGGNKLYTFKYDGAIIYTDSMMTEAIKKDFAEQLCEDYKCGIMFELEKVRNQLKKKSQYRMKM